MKFCQDGNAGVYDVAKKVAEEGMVLLKNDNRTLPLKKGQKVSVFGRVQIDTIRSGSGSANASTSPAQIHILDALRSCGIVINEELAAVYEKWTGDNPAPALNSGVINDHYTISNYQEMPVTQEQVDNARIVSDTAILVIGRMSGEGGDRLVEKGDYYLTDIEEDMVAKVSRAFDRIAVVINTCGIMDLNWIDKYGLDSVLMAWAAGSDIGGASVADILTGGVNPSGKLVDTIAIHYEDYPSAKNFGVTHPIYREDIYVGYRYFETLNIPVKYEFGFGLSYTRFVLDITGYRADRDAVRVRVKVTNDGKCAGKEVVQIYYSAPQGLLGKPAKQLAAFGKTDLLQPGESQIMEIAFKTNDMASYDDAGKAAKSAYILEAGDYDIYAGNSVKNVIKAGTYTVDRLVITEQLSELLAVQPSDVFKRLTADGEYETVPTKSTSHACENVTEIVYKGDQGYKLIDVFNRNTSMDNFISQFDVETLDKLTHGIGMASMGLHSEAVPGASGGFGGLPEYGIPVATMADGPSGLRIDSNVNGETTSLPIAICLSSAWNQPLLEQLGILLGKELALNNIDVWLAPALNIHRDPLCGRNYEYFSEDPVLSGTIASAISRGVQSQGIAVTIKHFAANNSETDRRISDSIVSERALREIYLKGFEIAVKTADPAFVMTSYNKINGSYAASNIDLNTYILRKEWNYQGTVMTDWFASKDKEDGSMIRAQNDLSQPAGPRVPSTLLSNFHAGEVTIGEIQRSVKNVLNSMMKMMAFGKLNGLSDNFGYVAPSLWFDVITRNGETT